MKYITTLIIIAVSLILIFANTRCTRIDPTEHAFWYSQVQEKPVNADNNPLLPSGMAGGWGWNTVCFTVTKEVLRHTFTSDAQDSSPYDESLTWDSSEGVTMATNWTLSVQVTDPYVFFQSFGDLQYGDSYDEKSMGRFIKDIRLYECIRQLGLQASKLANEINATVKADEIQRDPAVMKATMLAGIRDYATNFGVVVKDIEFPGRFIYPDGDSIESGRRLLTEVETELRSKENELATAKAQANLDLQEARMEAENLIGEATKRSNTRKAETDQLVAALAASIKNIGAEGTFTLEMAAMQRRLIESGVIPEVIVTERSIFAAPYYPSKETLGSPPTVIGSPPAIP